MIVLDTNVISEVMRPAPDAKVVAWLRRHPTSDLAITAITIAEIRYGLRRLAPGRRRDNLEAQFATFVARGFSDRVLAFDAAAAEIFAEIVVARQATGRPIEAFDAMIAAIARSHVAAVATRDVAGFAGCGIGVVDPWSG